MAPSVGDRAVPSGWERTPDRGDEFGFQRESGEIAVVATRTRLGSRDDSDADDEWELKISREVEGASIVEPFGHVSDQAAAVGALVSCMKAVNLALTDDPVEAKRLTAGDLSLGDAIRP